MVLGETFGNFAFAIAISRARPARSRPGALTLQRLHDPHRGSRRCRCACSAIPTMRWRWRSISQTIPRWNGLSYPGLEGDRYNALAQALLPEGRRRGLSPSALKGGYDAGVSLVSRLQLFLASGPISAIPARWSSTPASTTHRQLTDEQRVAAGAGPEVVRPLHRYSRMSPISIGDLAIRPWRSDLGSPISKFVWNPLVPLPVLGGGAFVA